MIILDTNVLSELMRSQGSISLRQWVAAQPMTSLFTTTITQSEILSGIALLPPGTRQAELNQAAGLMFAEDFAGRILPFDEAAAIAFADITAQRRRAGNPMSHASAQIASISYSRDAPIATRNIADFEGCRIKTIDPWKTES